MAPINPKVLESLNQGISSEIKSYVFYKEAAKKIADGNIKNALLQLAGEEKEHYQILEKQHHSLITSEQWVSYNDILKQEGLPELNENMAESHRELIEQVNKTTTEREILDIALGLEEEAKRIFTEASERAVDPQEKRTFDYLVKFELGHVRLIQKLIDEL